MKNTLSLSILVVALICILSGSSLINDDCEELRKENEMLKTELHKIQQVAEAQRKLAVMAAAEARRQSHLAEEARKMADMNCNEARRQEQLAREVQLKLEQRLRQIEDSLKRRN